MMGACLFSADTPVVKTSNSFIAEKDYREPVQSACIRCGRCVRGCPMHLMPSYLAMFSMQGKLDMAESFDVMSCVECGTCSYNCPGHVPIVQYIRAAKGQIGDRRRAEKAALEKSRAEKPEKPDSEKKQNDIKPEEKAPDKPETDRKDGDK